VLKDGNLDAAILDVIDDERRSTAAAPSSHGSAAFAAGDGRLWRHSHRERAFTTLPLAGGRTIERAGRRASTRPLRAFNQSLPLDGQSQAT